MTDEQALLRTIRDNPKDPGPMFVYADWLEERGECEQAELFRLKGSVAGGCEFQVGHLTCIEQHANQLKIRTELGRWLGPAPTLIRCRCCDEATHKRIKELEAKYKRKKPLQQTQATGGG